MLLYPLGEYLPFRDSVIGPLLQFFVGESRADYDAGTERLRYSVGVEGPRYAVALCSELKFDHLRGLESGSDIKTKPYEMLVNIANEGLFQRNGMPEIFAFCASLRAIENRVTVVRSSNSGITGFWDPTGKPYGMVTNAKGQVQSGIGAAELAPLLKVVQFRNKHEHELLSNPSRRDELSCLIEDVDRIRLAAAVEGYSSQRVYWLPERTIFNEYGVIVKLAMVSSLLLLNVMLGLSRIRDIIKT
jgi:hypothetical protein